MSITQKLAAFLVWAVAAMALGALLVSLHRTRKRQLQLQTVLWVLEEDPQPESHLAGFWLPRSLVPASRGGRVFARREANGVALVVFREGNGIHGLLALGKGRNMDGTLYAHIPEDAETELAIEPGKKVEVFGVRYDVVEKLDKNRYRVSYWMD